jgi:hypothetical protein
MKPTHFGVVVTRPQGFIPNPKISRWAVPTNLKAVYFGTQDRSNLTFNRETAAALVIHEATKLGLTVERRWYYLVEIPEDEVDDDTGVQFRNESKTPEDDWRQMVNRFSIEWWEP